MKKNKDENHDIKNVKPPLIVEEIMKLVEENNKLKLEKPIGEDNEKEKKMKTILTNVKVTINLSC